MAALLFLFALPNLGWSQESNFGNWMIYIGNKKVNSKWNIHHEVQYRNYDAIGDLEQLLLRTGLGYNLSNMSNVLLGYGFIQSENYFENSDEKFSVQEHRIFQQFITKQKVGKINLSHRYRFEERFVESDFKFRFRYFLGLNIPLKNSEDGTKRTLYISSYNEIFLNSESSVFDRNRLFLGLGYNVSTNLRLELGYMNQFFETNSRDQINIITFVNF